MAPRPLSMTATWMLLGAAAISLGGFAKLSQELFFDEAGGQNVVELDQSMLAVQATARQVWLTPVAMDLTALGSPVVLGILVAMLVLVLGMTRDRLGASLVVGSAAGAAFWTVLLKHLIERPRPTLVTHLVDVDGFSYPSGHSLASAAILMSGAFIACRHLERRSFQFIVLAATFVIVLAVAASRVYLGVHYPTDVIAGTSFGLAWSFFGAAAMNVIESRRFGS